MPDNCGRNAHRAGSPPPRLAMMSSRSGCVAELSPNIHRMVLGTQRAAVVPRALGRLAPWLLVLFCACTPAPPQDPESADELPVTLTWTFEPAPRGAFAATPLVAGDNVYAVAAHDTG